MPPRKSPSKGSSLPATALYDRERGDPEVKVPILALAAALITASPLAALRAQEAKPSAFAVATKYTCVMHPEVVSDKPGKCPKCGMELVAMKPEDSPSPEQHAMHEMHAHQMLSGMSDMQMLAHEMSMQSSISIADPMARASSHMISRATSTSAIPASRRSGRRHSCIGLARWITRMRLSAIIGRIQRTSRSPSRQLVLRGRTSR